MTDEVVTTYRVAVEVRHPAGRRPPTYADVESTMRRRLTGMEVESGGRRQHVHAPSLIEQVDVEATEDLRQRAPGGRDEAQMALAHAHRLISLVVDAPAHYPDLGVHFSLAAGYYHGMVLNDG